MTDKQCPHCGSNNFHFTEICKIDREFSVEYGRVISFGMGDFYQRVSVTCTCDNCGHKWHPKDFEYDIDEGI